MHSPPKSASAIAVNLISLAAICAAGFALARHSYKENHPPSRPPDKVAGNIFESSNIANWARDTIAAEELLNRARSLESAGRSEHAKELYRRVREHYRHLDQASTAAEELDLLDWIENHGPYTAGGPTNSVISSDELPEVDVSQLPLPAE